MSSGAEVPTLTKAEICMGFQGLRNALFDFGTERLKTLLFHGFMHSYNVVKRVSTPPPTRSPPASHRIISSSWCCLLWC